MWIILVLEDLAASLILYVMCCYWCTAAPSSFLARTLLCQMSACSFPPSWWCLGCLCLRSCVVRWCCCVKLSLCFLVLCLRFVLLTVTPLEPMVWIILVLEDLAASLILYVMCCYWCTAAPSSFLVRTLLS